MKHLKLPPRLTHLLTGIMLLLSVSSNPASAQDNTSLNIDVVSRLVGLQQNAGNLKYALEQENRQLLDFATQNQYILAESGSPESLANKSAGSKLHRSNLEVFGRSLDELLAEIDNTSQLEPSVRRLLNSLISQQGIVRDLIQENQQVKVKLFGKIAEPIRDLASTKTELRLQKVEHEQQKKDALTREKSLENELTKIKTELSQEIAGRALLVAEAETHAKTLKERLRESEAKLQVATEEHLRDQTDLKRKLTTTQLKLGTFETIASAELQKLKNTTSAQNSDLKQKLSDQVENLNREVERLNAENRDLREKVRKLNSLVSRITSRENKKRRLIMLLSESPDISLVNGRLQIASDQLFDSGRASLTADGINSISALANALSSTLKTIDNPESVIIRIDGHTDDRPTSRKNWQSNWELSSAKANAVIHTLLKAEELSPENLMSAGFGEFSPIALNDTRKNREKNRRVEITVIVK